MTTVPQTTYPTAQQVMNRARMIINDMQVTVNGQTLRNVETYTPDLINEAIEEVQEYLANNGITSDVVDNVILTPIGPVATTATGIQCYIDTTGYFNGSTIDPNVKLPPDTVLVLRCWQRQTGSNQVFVPMGQPEDGLMDYIPGPYFGYWEYRQDRINFVGSQNTLDLRIRYERTVATVAASTSDTDFANTTIRIKGGLRALAYSLAAVYCEARGAAQTPAIRQRAEYHMNAIVNRNVQREERIAFRRRGYGSTSIDGSLSGSYN